MRISIDAYDVAIAGAGPAGTSAAIHLAMHGARVLLVEQKRFPRAKLCGESISPECLGHFEQLGVADQIISAGGASLTHTVFYSSKGYNVSVPNEWFASNSIALGLSRAAMDKKLLDRAKAIGVSVLEETQVSDSIVERGCVRGVRLKSGKVINECYARITIDATGRTRALARHLNKEQKAPRSKRKFVAFKAHLENTRVAKGVCEIYSYPGGYGGLSSIEGEVANFCFIASAPDVRRCGSDPEMVVREIVVRNARAAYALENAHARTEWLSVSLESFGLGNLVPAEGLLAIGDAAAFIDPFSGSGMLMALESGAVAAQTIINHLDELRAAASFTPLAREYRQRYRMRFNSRLRICGLLRRAAFIPTLAEATIICLGASSRLLRKVACTIRPLPQP